jgi:hypothetical protein
MVQGFVGTHSEAQLRKSLSIHEIQSDPKQYVESILKLGNEQFKMNLSQMFTHPISISFRSHIQDWEELINNFELNSENMIWFYPFVFFSMLNGHFLLSVVVLALFS